MILIDKKEGLNIEFDEIQMSQNVIIQYLQKLFDTLFSEKSFFEKYNKFNINEQFIQDTYEKSITQRLRSNYEDFKVPLVTYQISTNTINQRDYNKMVRDIVGMKPFLQSIKRWKDGDIPLSDKEFFKNTRLPYINYMSTQLNGELTLKIFTETYQELNMIKKKLFKHFLQNQRTSVSKQIDIKSIVQKSKNSDDEVIQQIQEDVEQYPYPIYLSIPQYLTMTSYSEDNLNTQKETQPNIVQTTINFEWDSFPISEITFNSGILNLDVSIDVIEK